MIPILRHFDTEIVELLRKMLEKVDTQDYLIISFNSLFSFSPFIVL
jgi:hypothetical protein